MKTTNKTELQKGERTVANTARIASTFRLSVDNLGIIFHTTEDALTVC